MRMHKEMNYNRNDLVKIIKSNRSKHAEVYALAMKEYRKELKEELEEMLDDLEKGKKVTPVISLVEPVEYLSDYDRAITMFEMTTDEIIKLSSDVFSPLVMDEWNWQHDFAANTLSYTSAV